jgi:hypothetical protein
MSDVTSNDEAAADEVEVEVDLANLENLRQYWTTGAGGAKIRWGTEGDLTRCHNAVLKAAKGELTSDDAWGFCNNLHKRMFGRPNDPND